MYRPNKIIVVGGNAAGPAAAAKAKRINRKAEVTLFEAGDFISTGTCELPYLFSKTIDDYSKLIFFSPEKFLKEKGVKVYTNHLVKKINRKNKELLIYDKRNDKEFYCSYDRLILTTGSKAKELPELPFSIENVFAFKAVSDYIKINKYISQNNIKNILIIGSGYIGLELSDTLTKAKFNITLLEKEELPLPSSDEEIRHLILEIIKQKEIRFLKNSSTTKFIIKNNKFFQLKNEGRYLDLAIVAIGVKPNVELAKKSALKIGNKNGLVTCKKLKTNDPNIYAAGDNIEVKNFITGKYDYMPLATYAHKQGHIAGTNAAGGNEFIEDVVLNVTFKFFDNFVAKVGLTFEQAKQHFFNIDSVSSVTINKVKIMPCSRKVFGKIIFNKDNNLILGASFIGGEEVSGFSDIISTCIHNKIPAENLARINYNYTPTLSPFINLLSILGRKILEKTK
ncbi:MAG: hypothetical protein CR986_04575 [Ignavibacteriae bacterium]|nr:MAG: hypothetical protein CR986_04575 [Ignavibacteriota bacterium]